MLANMRERIQKVLADAGVASRRAIEEMVEMGRVAVNGETRARLPVIIDPATDRITLDGEPIDLQAPEATQKVYILMHKPKGVYSTNVAQGEQKRAIDLLPPNFDRRVYPVGRLDADSRGLLLLTNDGELTQQLTHPKFGVAKTYTAVVDGFISPDTVARLSEGIWLADPSKGRFRTGKSYIKIVKRGHERSVLQITIKEGRNRQVRRMLANVGHKVRELTRVKIGPLELGNLKPGDSRMLSPREIKDLRAAIAAKIERAAAVDADAKATKFAKPSRSTGRSPRDPRATGRPPREGSATSHPPRNNNRDRDGHPPSGGKPRRRPM
jgi:pseudouridine synthase